MNYSVFRSGKGRKPLSVDEKDKLGRGATATVYRVSFERREYAAKIYHIDREFNGEKIRAMLDSPPDTCDVIHNGQDYPQLAWPIAIIKNNKDDEVGFLLPLVDTHESFTLDHYYDQGLFKKLNSKDESALSYRLEIAKNLSKIIADLHRHGHYFIDCKPQNIRVFKRTHIVTLIDCDGFSINGKDARFPAELLSTDYICPEAQRRLSSPAELGEAQDRYALAVILFQLLNRGTHPFQGIVTDPTITINTNDEKSAAGLYPHGQVPNIKIQPRLQSTHHLWDQGTRALFDQAFTTGSPSARPSAQDWTDHFEQLLVTKTLVRCDVFRNDLEHIRFKGMGCPTCYLKAVPGFTPPPQKQRATVAPTPTHSFTTSSKPTPVVSADTGYKLWIFWGLVILFLLWVFNSNNRTTAPASSDPSQQVPAPAPEVPVPAPQAPASADPVLEAAARPLVFFPLKAESGKYISLYISKSRAIGYSIGDITEVDADSKAWKECNRQATNQSDDQCIKIISGIGECLSVSRSSDGAVGAAIGPSPLNAATNAQASCRDNGGQDCPYPSEVTFCN